MKRFFLIFLVISVLIIFTSSAFASSGYVLPYPSSMPGSILYKPRLLWEVVLKYWYFGNFGQFKYNLKESDKYLVESKTLFEYNQFLNAYTALKKSDDYFSRTLPYLFEAKKEGKDISINRNILKDAAEKHIEVLQKLEKEVPSEFEWKPEKSTPTTIRIKSNIDESIAKREKYL